MLEYQLRLTELLQLTEEIFHKAQAIRSTMEDNDTEQIIAVQELFNQREITIQGLDQAKQQPAFKWSDEDQKIISKLKVLEQQLQPLMNGLHQAFLTQINRISQTKQVSKKYIGAYQNTAAGGSFIDQRK